MTREQHPVPPPPSDLVRRRLARDVHHEVAELRTRLTETQLRAEVFLTSGLPDEAQAVLDEQHELLEHFRTRVGAALSDAAVEREAERVLAGTPDLARLAGLSVPVHLEADAAGADADVVELVPSRSRLGRIADRLPAAMSAAAAGVTAIALVLVGLAGNGNERTEVAIEDVRSPGQPSPTDADEPTEVGLPEGTVLPDPRLARLRFERALIARQQADPEVGWLLTRQRELLARLGEITSGTVTASLLELESLVEQLLATAADVELSEVEQWMRIEAQRARDAAEDESRAPEDESSPEPTPEPEPSDEPSDDDGGLFPVGGDEPSDEPTDDEPSDEPADDEPSDEPTNEPGEEGSDPMAPDPTQSGDQKDDDSDEERQQDGSLLPGGGG